MSPYYAFTEPLKVSRHRQYRPLDSLDKHPLLDKLFYCT